MKNEINAVLENMTATTPEPEDYTGEDGLLYCCLLYTSSVVRQDPFLLYLKIWRRFSRI